MRLKELDPRFLKITVDDGDRLEFRNDWPRVHGCDGIRFECPKCRNHDIICWQPHVPQHVPPIPGRWTFQGSGINDLTLVAGSSSIALTSGCRAHFFISSGGIVMA